MNYRHAFHAGNFADVFKHAMLVRILLYLQRKDQPLRVIDIHGGIGRYDLASDEAARTGEWREGIGRILSAEIPEAVAALLKPWLEIVGPGNAQGMPVSYPGSPALALALMRPQDRLAVSELHPEDFHKLRRALGRDDRLRLAQMDGYAALNAWTPPKERRGLVLIDPPFESRSEFVSLLKALDKAYRKWPTGCYAIWYPVKSAGAVEDFYAGLQDIGISRLLRLELAVDRAEDDGPLAANGLCVINPPFALQAEAEVLLPWLAKTLGRSRHAAWRADLHEPAS
jgi:23S rRNA (adenine2030-N6)-methyltransferase